MFLFIVEFYNRPQFCLNQSWHKSGTTISTDKRLNPSSIFVSVNNFVYVCCYRHSGNKWRFLVSNLFWMRSSSIPKSFFVVPNGNIYVDNGVDKRIYKWAARRISSQISLGYYDKPCYGLFADNHNTIYCCLKDLHKVIKSLKDQREQWKTTAGNGSKGRGLKQLNEPHGIFVDINFDLYVADSINNRIQLLKLGELNGTTVVNNNTLINKVTLKYPTGITLDANNNLYIVDSGNHRIVIAEYNFTHHRCLVGCSAGSGSTLDKLNQPLGMSFDRFGNIYVGDTKNKRVQKFNLATQNCGELSKYLAGNKLFSQLQGLFWFYAVASSDIFCDDMIGNLFSTSTHTFCLSKNQNILTAQIKPIISHHHT
jgi:DNA-binding beta-propeller fold protein YncE